MSRGIAALALVLCVGCEARPDRFPVGFERMRDQPRADAYERSRFFDDGSVMRQPPKGAVSQEIGDEADARALDAVPIAITPALMGRGRNRYETFCAPCHDLDGSARSPVAINMQLRRPPALLDDRIRALSAGRVFQVITEGYGLMPSYAHQLSVDERWGVIAYVRALQLSQRATLAELPADVRAEAETALAREAAR
jgi:mono/diheme cytochrome c family protein